MKIEEISTFKLRRKPPFAKGFWEERLARPVDIYERFRDQGPRTRGEEEVFEQSHSALRRSGTSCTGPKFTGGRETRCLP